MVKFEGVILGGRNYSKPPALLLFNYDLKKDYKLVKVKKWFMGRLFGELGSPTSRIFIIIHNHNNY